MKKYPGKLLILLVALVALNPACSKTSFSNQDTDGSVGQIGAQTCSPLVNQTLPVKVVLVVDASGSNANQGNLYGTDPYKNLRGGSIQTFFDKYKGLSNFSWGFILFHETSAYSLIGSGFSTQPSQMQNAISDFYSIYDEGGTPYRAALSRARQLIQSDAGTQDTKYIVVFISDGLPEPAVSNSTLQSDIQSLMASKPGQVSLSTIYYGSINQQAADRLGMMASYGAGGFLDANTSYGQTFSIDSVIQVPGTCSP